MNKQGFIDTVNSLDSITPAEELITSYFMEHYTMLPFAKIDELCKQIGVGKATMGRFLQRLGFGGFLDFKKCVSDDLAQVLSTPIERYENDCPPENDTSVLATHLKEVTDNMEKTFSVLSEEDFDRAVAYMRQPKGKLYVIGSASAEPLAHYFYLLARYLRKDVVLLNANITTLPHQLVDVTQADTLLAISYHRFSSVTVRIARWFSQHGGKVITVTDQSVNPFVAYSDIQFNVESMSDGLFNNRTAGFCLIEAFIKGLSSKPEKDNRFNRIESLFTEFGMFKT